MIIVAGQILVEPDQRETYLQSCMEVIERARKAPGCLDFALTADLLTVGRINVFERWESAEAVQSFRGDGPSQKQHAQMISASVSEYDVSTVRDLT
jgi:quinol monooxygenase YgiN